MAIYSIWSDSDDENGRKKSGMAWHGREIETLNHIAFRRITETPAAAVKQWTRNQIL